MIRQNANDAVSAREALLQSADVRRELVQGDTPLPEQLCQEDFDKLLPFGFN
jgi:hypothetical protein